MTATHPDLDACPAPSLSALFRDGSRAEHEAAESSSFMSELLDSKVNRQGYADYLARLGRIYEAMESAGRNLAGHPLVAAVFDPALERGAAIAADQQFWGPGDADTQATDAYVARIRTIADDPMSFVAHHYTRYLGDLSGGRIIGRKLKDTYALDAAGLAFYDFADIPKPKPYKDSYRARLDGLSLTDEQKFAGLAEVKIVFGLNGAIFEELTADLGKYRRQG